MEKERIFYLVEQLKGKGSPLKGFYDSLKWASKFLIWNTKDDTVDQMVRSVIHDPDQPKSPAFIESLTAEVLGGAYHLRSGKSDEWEVVGVMQWVGKRTESGIDSTFSGGVLQIAKGLDCPGMEELSAAPPLVRSTALANLSLALLRLGKPVEKEGGEIEVDYDPEELYAHLKLGVEKIRKELR